MTGFPVADSALAAATLTGAVMQTAAVTGGNVQDAMQEAAALTQANVHQVQDTSVALKEQSQDQGNFLTKFARRIKEWTDQKLAWAKSSAQWRTDLMTRITHHSQTMARLHLNMVRFMAAMARFYPIIKIAVILIMIFSNALHYIIMFFAGLAIAVLVVIYKILSLPGLIYIPIVSYWSVMDLAPFLLYSIVFTILFLVIAAFCLLLAFLNVITSGGMHNFLFCENNPAGWYKMTNYHMKNIYSREFFCSKPCLKGYAPDVTGSFCERQKRTAPNYCPQASVMRIFTGDGRKDRKVGYSAFNTAINMNYRTSMPIEREKMLKEHFISMKKYMESCNDGLNRYNGVTKTICANIDVIEKYNLYGFKKNDIERMKLACAQSFCNSVNSYPFCANLSGISKDPDEMLIKLLVKYFTSIIIFLIVIITFMRILNEN
jgi:hypothetical protein